MRGFIEITQEDGVKVSLNTHYIFAVEPYEGDKCYIKLTPAGFNSYPFQTYTSTDTYEDVLSMIEKSRT